MLRLQQFWFRLHLQYTSSYSYETHLPLINESLVYRLFQGSHAATLSIAEALPGLVHSPPAFQLKKRTTKIAVWQSAWEHVTGRSYV